MYFIVDEDGEVCYTTSKELAVKASEENEALIVIDTDRRVVLYDGEEIPTTEWLPPEEDDGDDDGDDEGEDDE